MKKEKVSNSDSHISFIQTAQSRFGSNFIYCYSIIADNKFKPSIIKESAIILIIGNIGEDYVLKINFITHPFLLDRFKSCELL